MIRIVTSAAQIERVCLPHLCPSLNGRAKRRAKDPGWMLRGVNPNCSQRQPGPAGGPRREFSLLGTTLHAGTMTAPDLARPRLRQLAEQFQAAAKSRVVNGV
jgi:hypothetical protein